MNQGFIGWSHASVPASVRLLKVIIGATYPPGSTITLDVPQGFEALRMVASLRGDAAVTNTTAFLRFNGDAGSNYDYIFNSSGGVSNLAAQAGIVFARVASASAPANTFSTSVLRIPDYGVSTKNHDVIFESSLKIGTTNTSFGYDPGAGFWRNSDPIRQISFILSSGNFVTNSTFWLYGET